MTNQLYISNRAASKRTNAEYVAFYEDAAKAEAAARARGFTGDDGESWHDFIHAERGEFKTAKAFATLREAVSWLRAEVKAFRTFYGSGTVRLTETVERRDRCDQSKGADMTNTVVKKTAAPKINRALAKKVLRIVDAGLSSGLGKPKPGEMCVEAAVCYALGRPHGDDPKCVSPALRYLKIALNDKAWSSNEARAKGMRRLAIIQLGTAGELDDKAFAIAVAEMTIRTFVPIALRAAASMPANAAHKDKLEIAAIHCEKDGTRTAAYAANDAAYAAYAANDAAYAAYAAAYAANAAYNANAANDANAANAAAYAANDAANAAAYAANDAANAAAYAAAYAANAATHDSILSQFAESVVQILVKMGVKSAAFLALAPLEEG